MLVTEMGMRGAGQVAELCAIARPRVVVVTSIGPEHLELVGTVEDVAARMPRRSTRCRPAGSPSFRRTHPSSSHTCDGTTSTCVASTPLTWRGTSLVMMEHKATRRPRGGDFGSATPSSRSSCRSRSVTSPTNVLAALDGVRRARAAARPGARGRGSHQALALARRGARRCPPAGSSSTTPTTPTRSRCAPRWSISRSAPA